MLLTLLVLTHCRHETCTLFLKSLEPLFRDYRYFIELLLIDDSGSNYENQLVFPSYEIRYVRHKINLGYSKSLVHGILLSKGEYILQLADDDIISYNGFSEILEYLRVCEASFISTLFRFKSGGGIRGRHNAFVIYPSDFFDSSFHAPGLIYKNSIIREILSMSLFDAVRQEYYFQIFPQSIIALFCICFYGPSVWFPVEVVLEHNPQQSNLKDGDKFHYKNIFSRIRQLSSFYNIISLLKPDLSSAQYLDIVFYWDIKAKQDLIDNFSLEFPHIVQFFNSSFISRLHLFVHYPRRFIFLYSQLLYNKLHNIRN